MWLGRGAEADLIHPWRKATGVFDPDPHDLASWVKEVK
jgi:hypothetical protein